MPDKDAAGASGIAEAVRRYIDELAERGEGRARDLQRSARELADRSAKNRRELMGLISKEIRRQIAALGVATKSDVDRLGKRVRDLEKTKTPKKASAKPKPKGSKTS